MELESKVVPLSTKVEKLEYTADKMELIEPIDLLLLLKNQVKLDLLLLSLYGTMTGEKFMQKKTKITERMKSIHN